MKIMCIVGNIIDMAALIIQTPYVFIAGCIMGWTHRPGITSKGAYLWCPTYGAIKFWMNPDGNIACDIFSYKELFH